MSVPAEQRQTDAAGAGSLPDPALPPSRWVAIATIVVLVVIGVQLALLGGFLTLSEPHLLGIPLPLGPAVGLIGNGAAGLWIVRLLNNRMAVAAPALGWILTVLPLSATRPEGDLIITNDVKGLAFLLLGSLAWAGAAIFGRAGVPADARAQWPASRA